jgi:hypothetical protein
MARSRGLHSRHSGGMGRSENAWPSRVHPVIGLVLAFLICAAIAVPGYLLVLKSTSADLANGILLLVIAGGALVWFSSNLSTAAD